MNLGINAVQENSNMLPIEDDPALLQEYGRAFAWINLVEEVLELTIFLLGRLDSAERKLVERLLDRKTLGAKIVLSKDLISPDLYQELFRLNKERTKLAHSVVGERRDAHNVGQRTGDYVVGKDGKETALNQEYLKEVSALAQSISTKLREEIVSHAKSRRRSKASGVQNNLTEEGQSPLN